MPQIAPAPRSFARRISHSLALAVLLVVPVLWLAGCGGDKSTAPGPNPSSGVVTVTPGSARVIARTTLELHASVTDLPTDSVTWSLVRHPGLPDTASIGTLTPTGRASAIYAAPDRVQGSYDYQIDAVATSVADTLAKGVAMLTVPRVTVLLKPANLSSVPPGTLIPYEVTVRNAVDPGFRLYVAEAGVGNFYLGGDPSVGTWTETAPGIAVYHAPDQVTPVTANYDLLTVSVQDSARFGSGLVTVRRGFRVPVQNFTVGQFAPAWNPLRNQLAFAQGPPWEVVVYDFATLTERVLTPFLWSQPEYDGQVDWSSDGTQIAFSEETPEAHRAIGVVSATGGAHATLDPDPLAGYYEGAFLVPATAGVPESLVVSVLKDGVWSLIALPASAAPGEAGRTVYAAGAGITLRWPDATRVELATGEIRPYFAFEVSDGAGSEVATLVDTGPSGALTIATSGPGQRTHVRWAQSAGPLWITYILDTNGTAYRVLRQGVSAAQRLYSEFFPELGADFTTTLGYEAQAISRRAPGDPPHLWIVGFPPPEFTGVPKAEEMELASMGIRGALSAASWQRWLGNYDLAAPLAPLRRR